MSKTVVQMLEDERAKVTKLEAELKAAKDDASKARLSAVSVKPTPAAATGTGNALTAESAKAIYAQLPTADRKEFRRANWKLLGIAQER